MSNMVNVPFGDDQAETATLLLAAAEKSKDHEQHEVGLDTYSNTFVVPEQVAKDAGLDYVDLDADFAAKVSEAEKVAQTPSVNAAEVSGEVFADPGPSNADVQASEDGDKPKPVKKAPAKKAAAKKAPAKKAAAKKAPAKKTADNG